MVKKKKTLKNLLQNQESFEVESSYIASETQGQFSPDFKGPSVEEILSICSNASALLNKMATMTINGKKNTYRIYRMYSDRQA